jgi:hypothetical protein
LKEQKKILFLLLFQPVSASIGLVLFVNMRLMIRFFKLQLLSNKHCD